MIAIFSQTLWLILGHCPPCSAWVQSHVFLVFQFIGMWDFLTLQALILHSSTRLTVHSSFPGMCFFLLSLLPMVTHFYDNCSADHFFSSLWSLTKHSWKKHFALSSVVYQPQEALSNIAKEPGATSTQVANTTAATCTVNVHPCPQKEAVLYKKEYTIDYVLESGILLRHYSLLS